MSPHESNSNQLVALVNGRPSTTLSILDRAAAYGDGLFETVALVDGQPQNWVRHYRRLARGCAQLFIDCPREELWQNDLDRAIALRTLPKLAILKLTLSRGESQRGYAPDPAASPTRVLQLSRWPISIANDLPLTVTECSTRLGLNRALVGIKHLNRLEQVLGAREVLHAKADEGIMFDVKDRVISGTRSNIFIVLADHRVCTPLLEESGVAGIMREIVLEQSAVCGITIQETAISRTDLRLAEEIFFTNSLWGIRPAGTYLQARQGTRTLSSRLGTSLRAHLQQRQLLP